MCAVDTPAIYFVNGVSQGEPAAIDGSVLVAQSANCGQGRWMLDEVT